MSLPTPTGNPYPYPPDHPLHDVPGNLLWILRLEGRGARPFPTEAELNGSGLFASFMLQLQDTTEDT